MPSGAAAAGAAAGWPAAAKAAAGEQLLGSKRRLFEYCRPGWEYHAKGIWISLPAAEAGDSSSSSSSGSGSSSGGSSSGGSSGGNSSDAAAPAPPPAGSAGGGEPTRWAAPAVTSVGSSNYGWRSLRRDLELNFLLVTRNPQLQQVTSAAGLPACGGC